MGNFGSIPKLWNLDNINQTKAKSFHVWASISLDRRNTHSPVSPGDVFVLLVYTLVRGRTPRKGYFRSFRNTFSKSIGSVRNTYQSFPSLCLQIGPYLWVQFNTRCCILSLAYFAEMLEEIKSSEYVWNGIIDNMFQAKLTELWYVLI